MNYTALRSIDSRAGGISIGYEWDTKYKQSDSQTVKTVFNSPTRAIGKTLQSVSKAYR
ncbi:hypothetical protein V7187_12310 [Gottfriedia acidiceleris]